MKNLLKLTFVLFTFVGLSQNTFAQVATFSSSGVNNVEVSAVINVPITFTSTNVSFGEITTGLASNVQANGSDVTTSTNDGIGASAGSITISGAEGQNVQVSWTNATLDNAAAEGVINFTTRVYNGASLLTSGTGSVTLSGTIGDGSTTGTITLDVGGTLSASSFPGTFSTTETSDPVVFTAEYN